MIDPESRAEMISQTCRRMISVGVVLFDLMLGRASAQDPASPLAQAINDTRAKGEKLLSSSPPWWARRRIRRSVDEQVGILEDAGVVVLPSNAQAARFAAVLVKPELLEDA